LTFSRKYDIIEVEEIIMDTYDKMADTISPSWSKKQLAQALRAEYKPPCRRKFWNETVDRRLAK